MDIGELESIWKLSFMRNKITLIFIFLTIVREGFPEWTPQQFIAFLCKKTNAQPANKITRIEFKKVK